MTESHDSNTTTQSETRYRIVPIHTSGTHQEEEIEGDKEALGAAQELPRTRHVSAPSSSRPPSQQRHAVERQPSESAGSLTPPLHVTTSTHAGLDVNTHTLGDGQALWAADRHSHSLAIPRSVVDVAAERSLRPGQGSACPS